MPKFDRASSENLTCMYSRIFSVELLLHWLLRDFHNHAFRVPVSDLASALVHIALMKQRG